MLQNEFHFRFYCISERVVKRLDRYVSTVQWILLGSDLEKVSLSSRFLRRQRRKSQNLLLAMIGHVNRLHLPSSL